MDTTVRTRPRVIKALIAGNGGYAPLARRIGTSAGYLHDIAHGRRIGSVEILERLAGECGVELEDITDSTAVA